MKAAILEENRRKVQRRKEEALFTHGIQQNYRLSHLDNIRTELQQRSDSARDDGAFPRRPRSPSPPREEPVRRMHAFSMNARCVEPVHGGASLWTGEADGSIGVRNGVSGEIAYRVSAAEGSTALVDTLYCSGLNMFVGMSDGVVRVYDPVVFVLSNESRRHTKSVTSFAATFDQRTFSCSLDGSLVKWDSDAGGCCFVSMAEQDNPLLCVATYGYNVFAGTEDGMILVVDTDTLEITRTMREHKSRVNAMVVQDGYLFSGSSDASLIVWNISTGAALAVLSHGDGISSMFGDSVGRTVWAVELSGTMRVWSTNDEDNFCLVRAVQHESSAGDAYTIRGTVALDAVKVWSVGSNGVNKVWHSAINRVEDHTRTVISTMSGIIEQDEIELVKWDGLTKTLQDVSRHVDSKSSAACLAQQENGVRQRYFATWHRWVWERQERRTQVRVAEMLYARTQADAQRNAFGAWSLFLQGRLRRKRLEATAEFLQAQHQRRLITVYSKKLADISAAQQRSARAARVSEVLAARSTKSTLASTFQMLQDYCIGRQLARKRDAIADGLAAIASRRIAVRAFSDWLIVGRGRRERVLRLAATAHQSDAISRQLLARAWRTWHDDVKRRAAMQRTIHVLSASSVASTLLLGHSCWRKWREWTTTRRLRKTAEQREDNGAHIEDLTRSIKSIDHLLQRRKLLDEADAAIRKALKAQEAKRALRLRLEEDIRTVEQQIEAKRSHQPVDVERSLQEQLADLLSMLKCKLLNFFSDFQQIQRVSDRTKKLGAEKVFLEAHQAVKRVVVEMTHEGYLPADKEWPLSDSTIRKMKSHHTETVLAAIKTMIGAYDALDAQQRASLTSDQEIVVNAHNLHLLADRCLAARMKRQGGKK